MIESTDNRYLIPSLEMMTMLFSRLKADHFPMPEKVFYISLFSFNLQLDRNYSARLMTMDYAANLMSVVSSPTWFKSTHNAGRLALSFTLRLWNIDSSDILVEYNYDRQTFYFFPRIPHEKSLPSPKSGVAGLVMLKDKHRRIKVGSLKQSCLLLHCYIYGCI